MSKAEETFGFAQRIRALFVGKKVKRVPRHVDDNRVDPALLSFARVGLLAYYTNPL